MCATDTIYVYSTQIYKMKNTLYGFFKNGGQKIDIDSQDCHNNGPIKPVLTLLTVDSTVIPNISIFIFNSVVVHPYL